MMDFLLLGLIIQIILALIKVIIIIMMDFLLWERHVSYVFMPPVKVPMG